MVSIFIRKHLKITGLFLVIFSVLSLPSIASESEEEAFNPSELINHHIKDAVLYGNTTYGITAFKLTQHTRILSISLVCVL